MQYSTNRDWYLSAAGFLAGLVVLGVVYSRNLVSLIETWARSGEFQHGFLIFPISAGLIWTKRHELRRCRVSQYPAAAVILLLLGLLSVAGSQTDINLIMHFSLVASIPVLIAYFFGLDVVKTILFPLGYMLFAVPAGQELVGPLQDITAFIVVLLIKLTGIPVYRQDIFISIPAGDFEVAEACSGIRFMIALTSVACAYVYLTYDKYLKRVLFVILSIGVAIIANSIRGYGTIMVAHLTDMRMAVGADHIIYGWQFYGVVMFLLFWIGTRWRDPITTSFSLPENFAHASSIRVGSIAGMFALLVLVLMPNAVLSYHSSEQADERQVSLALTAPAGRGAWSGPIVTTHEWTPLFKGYDGMLAASYKASRTIDVYVAAYTSRQERGKLFSAGNQLYKPSEWVQIDHSTRRNSEIGDTLASVNELHLRSRISDRLVLHWYMVDNRYFSNQSTAMLYESWLRLIGQKSISALITVSLGYDGVNRESALAELYEFVRVMGKDLDTVLRTSDVVPARSDSNSMNSRLMKGAVCVRSFMSTAAFPELTYAQL